MADVNDMDLLREYADHKLDAAFGGLVRRHLNLVYSVALRYTGNAADAQDVAQAVFVLLAQKAAALRERTTLTGWLYETTRLVARQSLRTRTRQQTRDQEACMQSALNETGADDVWQKLAPLLEEGMSRLNEDERTLLALRFYENKSAGETAALLGIQEWAAHKRANRAVEKLRAYFARRGVVLTATGLTTAVAANAVSAAPAGLAAAISTATLTGTAVVSTATLIAATKTIAMTTLQKTLVTAALATAIGTGVYQAHQAGRLREQNQSLQQQLAPLTTQLQQLQQERDAATSQVASLADDLARNKSNQQELLKLRNELTLLRRNPASDLLPVNATASTSPVQNNGTSPEDAAREEVGRQLGMAVVRGDMGAFDKLLAESQADRQFYATNKAGLDEAQSTKLATQAFAPINAAFKVIAEAATSGNQPALDALTRCLQIPLLNGTAVHSLSGLAGNGDPGALDVLTHPDKYGAQLSSTITPLQPAADNGNQQAIDALAAIASNPKNQPLWYMTATSLTKAAADGNAVAVDALITMASSTNRNIQKAVTQALQGAAANQNAKAAAALRSLNLQ